MEKLIDQYDRKIDYFRISITDRCNQRCVYCMPEAGVTPISHDNILSFEEIEKVVKASVSLGINKIRITGGEPLIRKGIVDLISILSEIKGIDSLTMTTNGILLDKYAKSLKNAGLIRLNISLDTLDNEKYEVITKTKGFKNVIKGIMKAQEAGLYPVKINVVVIRGINDNEIADFINFSCRNNLYIRFIEFMPTNSRLFWKKEKYISMCEIKRRCEDFVELEKSDESGNGPAEYYRIKGAPGRIGFISPFSNQFCFRCNRLRLTAQGRLRSCLHNFNEIDLRNKLRQNASQAEIKELIKKAVFNKPEGHYMKLLESDKRACQIMSQIGG